MSDQSTAGAEAAPEPDRRGYRTALILLAIGAALLFLGFSQVWATAVVTQEGLPSLTFELKGREIQPAGSAAAILALAGIAGLVATRRFGRAVTGVLLVGEGLLAAGGALWFGLGVGNRADVVRLVSEKAGIDVDPALSVTPWWLVVVVGGALLVVAGLAAAFRGGRWPVMGRRYERSPEPDVAATAAGATGVAAGATAASAWDQLDQGLDPTLEPTFDSVDGPTPDPTRSDLDGPAAGMMAATDAPEDTP
jgi:uncharacterized membrane protein (TIGR02234 family)